MSASNTTTVTCDICGHSASGESPTGIYAQFAKLMWFDDKIAKGTYIGRGQLVNQELDICNRSQRRKDKRKIKVE
jgi:hypothetical protein